LGEKNGRQAGKNKISFNYALHRQKYEAVRPELKVDGMQVIDNVLTTRELSFLFKKIILI